MPKFETIAKALKADGKYYPIDADGLRLRVRGGSALWELKCRAPNTTKHWRTVGLGSAIGKNALNLTEARRLADRRKIEVADGTFRPKRRGDQQRARQTAAEPTGKTFAEVLEEYLNRHAPSWRDGLRGEEAKAHRRLLKTTIAGLDIATLTQHDIVDALKPWEGRESAKKFVVKMRSVIGFAISNDYRKGDNPARAELMKNLLRKRTDEVKHHAALEAADVPGMMAKLAEMKDDPAARALRWLVLTAARTAEARGLRWGEVNGEWVTIPGARMKEKRDHRFPLTDAMRAVLPETRGQANDLVFGRFDGKRMYHLLKGLHPRATVHGLRATFVDWAGDEEYPAELRELALAHKVGDTVQQAYNRGDRLKLRLKMMQQWSNFATGRYATDAL